MPQLPRVRFDTAFLHRAPRYADSALTRLGALATLRITMAKRDRIIEVAAQIKTLRDELRRWETELDRLMSDAPTDLNSGTVAGVASAADALPARVLACINDQPTAAFTVEDLAKKLPDARSHGIGSTLARLEKAGKIRRLGRGRYTAVNGTSLSRVSLTLNDEIKVTDGGVTVAVSEGVTK